MKMKCFSKFVALSIIFLFAACKKEEIAPANQKDAFVKYYGHIRDQMASDVKQTADGGYLLLGSSNSFSAGAQYDYYLIKTDSLGNEEWSKTFGDRGDDFDEQGVSIVILQNEEGYLIAGNRTKMVDVNGQLRSEETNIVLYQLDMDGVVVWEKLLRPNSINSDKNDWVKDIRQIPGGGFILIGETTDVNITKNEYTLYSTYDKQDILVLKLNSTGDILWQSIRGFVGTDYGAAVECVNGDFLIFGSANIRTGGTPNSPVFSKEILVAKLKGTTGNEVIYNNYSVPDLAVTTVNTCYDTINGWITIAAHIDKTATGTNPLEGNLLILQVNEAAVEVQRKIIGDGLPNISQNLEAGAIALIAPQTVGELPSFIVTATHFSNGGNFGSEVVLMKLDPDFISVWSEPRLFGYPGIGTNWLSGNAAKKVFPVEELVPGTSRKELKGYAFTATFNTGTNNMIGLVKTNTEGLMNPQ